MTCAAAVVLRLALRVKGEGSTFTVTMPRILAK